MKIVVRVVTVLSLAVCLGVAVYRFLGLTSYSSYTTILAITSVVYFVAATAWAEMRG